MADALADLTADLERDGCPSLAWCVEHVTDGDLDAALARHWTACADVRTLLRLAARVVDRADLVQAACDCARAALRYVPTALTGPRRAIETAERAARGAATTAECREAAAVAADTVHSQLVADDDEIAEAAYAAAYAAEVAAAGTTAAAAHAAASAAGHAAYACAHVAVANTGTGADPTGAFHLAARAALGRLADVVRARLARPALAARCAHAGAAQR